MEIITTLLVAVTAFVSTNLDDLFVLITFFARKDFTTISVVLGQYIGVSSLILISSLAYFFKYIIPTHYLAILGIIPIIIGIKKLWDLKKDSSKDQIKKNKECGYPEKPTKNSGLSGTNTFQVAAVTFANGGDNIGVYAPLFASMSILQLSLTTVSFMVMIGLWCIISYFMVINKIFGDKIQKYGHIILPFVLILIGLMIINDGGFFSEFNI